MALRPESGEDADAARADEKADDDEYRAPRVFLTE